MTELPNGRDIERTAAEKHVGKGYRETQLIGCRHTANLYPMHVDGHANDREHPGEDGLARKNNIRSLLDLLHRTVFLYHEVIADPVDLFLHRLQGDLLQDHNRQGLNGLPDSRKPG